MNVAITGSHGYIGSVLRKMLTEQGHKVYVCDIKNSIDSQYSVRSYRGSFDDDNFVYTVVQNCDVVFHLAADSLLGPSAYDPLQYYWNNTARTTNFIQKLTQLRWKGHIIFSSTAAVYGSQDKPVEETSDLNPCNYYGKSKLMCEQVLDVAPMYGIDVTVFRYFNVAGAYEDVGQDGGEPHILTRMCNAAAGHVAAGGGLKIFGNDYPTPDGFCIRDFVHVKDICQAQIHAMNHPPINKQTRAYNLGTHNGTSVKELLTKFEQVTNIPLVYEITDRRIGDPGYLVANPNKFIQDTGFVYQYSNIDEIIDSAWKYYKRTHNGI